MIGSDHSPILVVCNSKVVSYKRAFKRWLGKEWLPETVERGWNWIRKFCNSIFMDRIANCRNSISW